MKLVIPGTIAFITTFWLGYGGIKDLIDLFKSPERRVINHLDNGSVSRNMSLADKAQLEAVEQQAADKK
ncbi:MAG: hypothetical protein E7043_03470 [Lentisphaerae bacterium]|nr:hypothetical protein [Lentisphaerota bacterium]